MNKFANYGRFGRTVVDLPHTQGTIQHSLSSELRPLGGDINVGPLQMPAPMLNAYRPCREGYFHCLAMRASSAHCPRSRYEAAAHVASAIPCAPLMLMTIFGVIEL